MHPILIKFGSLTIYSYGVMAAVGFALATLLIYRRASKFNVTKDSIIDLAILILITGVIGARSLYILSNLNYYLANPLEIPNLSKGGLVWYGGFLSALFASIWYTRKKGFSFWNVTDLMVPYVALAQAIGRVGCLLNGCCYGIEGHPVQIYSSLSLLVIFAILRLWQDRRHFAGEIFLAYCILYSFKRFPIEFLRGDNPRMMFGFTLSQCISIIVILISFTVFVYKAWKWKKRYSSLK